MYARTHAHTQHAGTHARPNKTMGLFLGVVVEYPIIYPINYCYLASSAFLCVTLRQGTGIVDHASLTLFFVVHI